MEAYFGKRDLGLGTWDLGLRSRGSGLGTWDFFLKRDSGLGTRDSSFDAIVSFGEKLSISILNLCLIFSEKALINCHSRVGGNPESLKSLGSRLRGNDGFIFNQRLPKSNFLSRKRRVGSLLAVLQTAYFSNTLELRFSSPKPQAPSPDLL